MINIGRLVTARQPEEALSAEAIDKLLRINKQEFKDNDKSNNTSMDDNDLDAEIGMIESTIEDN